jgi:hypothetical protein
MNCVEQLTVLCTGGLPAVDRLNLHHRHRSEAGQDLDLFPWQQGLEGSV